MSELTAGQLRKLIEDKPDDFVIPLYLKYGEAATNNIFARVDDVSTGLPGQPWSEPNDLPGLCVIISLVDSEDEDSDEDDSNCLLCDVDLEAGNGDNLDGLCPSCADRVSNHMDIYHLDRDKTIERLRVADQQSTLPPIPPTKE